MSVTTNHFPFLSDSMRNSLIAVQATIIAACALVAWIYGDLWSAVAATYGGGVALANAWLLALRVERVGELVKKDPHKGMYSLYIGAAQRFVLVLVGLAIGLGVFHLDAIPMVISFAVAQLAYVIAAGREALQ